MATSVSGTTPSARSTPADAKPQLKQGAIGYLSNIVIGVARVNA